MPEKTLYLLMGYPGSGKTTVSLLVSRITGAKHVWADKERVARFDNPNHSHEESLELYKQLNQEVAEQLSMGNSIVFDTNFSFYRDRQHLRQIASDNGAKCVLVWVKTPKQIARERATKDADKQPTRLLGNFSDKDFERMADNLEEPHQDENPIIIDGTRVNEDYIKECLNLN